MEGGDLKLGQKKSGLAIFGTWEARNERAWMGNRRKERKEKKESGKSGGIFEERRTKDRMVSSWQNTKED